MSAARATVCQKRESTQFSCFARPGLASDAGSGSACRWELALKNDVGRTVHHGRERTACSAHGEEDGGHLAALVHSGIRRIHRAACSRCVFHDERVRKRNAFVMTETELRLIASAANMGESSQPVSG